MSNSNAKKALVVATEMWPLAARISIALSHAGFRVAAVAASGGLTHKTKTIEKHYRYSRWSGANSIERAIESWCPDLLFPADDQATTHLHYLHHRASGRGNEGRPLKKIIEQSLGDPTNFVIAREKSKFIRCAQAAGARCPSTIPLAHDRTVESDFGGLDFPILVKADGTHGGTGVRLTKTADDVRDAVKKLSKRWRMPFRDLFNRQTFSPQTICLQQYIKGRPANRALVCWQGEVLAGISVEVVHSQSEFGPASVVRVIDAPEMVAVTAKLVKSLKLSGFIGFDFIIDAAERLWLLEMNARATPSSCMSVNGTDLAAAIFSRLTRKTKRTSTSAKASNETIVLFPQELIRAPHSPYLDPSSPDYRLDVPWHEPRLVRSCISYALEKGIAKRARRKLGIGLF
jgi:Carbamoyl-phosphate synthase L chain, ATP binding domain